MSASLPFQITPEAEQWLMRVSMIPEGQPGISYTLGYDMHSREGELTEEFCGEHYSIGYDTPSRWQTEHQATLMHIAGREFWMTSATLDTLRGKTLTVIRREVGRGSYAGKTRDLLVAV